VKKPQPFTHPITQEIYHVGDEVEIAVKWPGRTTIMRGTLISLTEDEAFVETALGPVAGDIATLERA